MNANPLREKRQGIMIHYSAGDFASTVDWCKRRESQVSYNVCIGPEGQIARIVPWDMRAWHAGVCKPSDPTRLNYADANSAFEGIALSGGPGMGPPTGAQLDTLQSLIRGRFRERGWSVAESWRITSHRAEAWPRGRKEDPEGPNPAKPWLSLTLVREMLP